MTPRIWKEISLVAWNIAVIAFALAVFFYIKTGYEFTWTKSFISDLGLASNPAKVKYLFDGCFVATGVMIIGLVFYQTGLSLPSRREHLARDLVMLLGLVFISIAFVPADLHKNLHRELLFATVVGSSIIWPLTFYRSKFYNIFSEFISIIMIFSLWLYLCFIIIAPRPEVSLAASQLQAQIEKSVFALVFIGTYILLTARPTEKKS